MINKVPVQDAAAIAKSRGFTLNEITPASRDERLAQLEVLLADHNVPFPIFRDRAKAYMQAAKENKKFGIGTLTDLTVELGQFGDQQDYDALSWEEHLSWAALVANQQKQKLKYASCEYLSGEAKFQIRGTTIPDYYLLNTRIYQQTGWQLATVNEIIPANVFFHCHSRKFFPVTTFMRPLDVDYLEEPDIGHDIAGHVATFTIPEVAWIMNQHGLANELIHQEKNAKLANANTAEERSRILEEANELLLYAGRIYWFTVEFGLVLEEGQLKAFGAGILSSPGETRYSVDSTEPNRIVIDCKNDADLLRLATTDYLISEYQKTYFVMSDFDSLATLTAERILETVKKAIRLPHHTWREVVPGDQVFNVGTLAMGPNEKYFAHAANCFIDDCVQRTASRNLELWQRGLALESGEEQDFVLRLPTVPVLSRPIETDVTSDYSDDSQLSLEQFLDELHGLDGPVALDHLKWLLERLSLDAGDLTPYLQFCNQKYQRNLIAEGENFEALLLCFKSGQRTPIHDHAGSACGVKVLEGKATETVFEPDDEGRLSMVGSAQLDEGGVVGSNDMDIHQLANLQFGKQDLVTLHIYSPPLGAVGNYSIIDNTCKRVRATRNRSS